MANPLDRTWFNTLVDDDGSGNTGTVWNKAAVDALLDSVDASLAGAVDKTGAPVANQIAIFTDPDTVTGSSNVAADPAGGLLLDSAGYAFVQLHDRSQPANGRLFRIVNAAGRLSLAALDDAGGLQGSIDVMRDGRLVLGGGRVTFPTPAIPSGDPATLDDYREGSFTPSWGGTGGASGQTYTIQTASYQLIGNRISIVGRLLLATLGTIGGSLTIKGLPFPASGAYYNPGSIRMTSGGGLAISVAAISGVLAGGASEVGISYLPAGGGTGFLALPASALQAGTDFFFEMSYFTA